MADNGIIRVSVKSNKSILGKLLKSVVYNSADYGISSSFTGKDVSMAIIDTGCPTHKDIKNITEHVNFVDGSKTYEDEHGHATMVAGLVAANNPKSIVGISPSCQFYFGKVSDHEGECDCGAIVAAVLWSIVKKVDIILLALGADTDYPVLHSAIKKAYESNICVIVSDPNKNGAHFPSEYPETLAFMAKPKGKDVKAKGDKIIIPMPQVGMATTWGYDKYIKAYGASFAAAIGAGMAALLIQKRRKEDDKPILPKKIYDDIRSIKISD